MLWQLLLCAKCFMARFASPHFNMHKFEMLLQALFTFEQFLANQARKSFNTLWIVCSKTLKAWKCLVTIVAGKIFHATFHLSWVFNWLSFFVCLILTENVTRLGGIFLTVLGCCNLDRFKNVIFFFILNFFGVGRDAIAASSQIFNVGYDNFNRYWIVYSLASWNTIKLLGQNWANTIIMCMLK